MKARKITRAIVSYSPINEVNNFHWIIDENGNEKPIRKNPYWMPISTQTDSEAIYIGVIVSEAANKEKQAETIESILSRFEGITPVIPSEYSGKPLKAGKSQKKSQKEDE